MRFKTDVGYDSTRPFVPQSHVDGRSYILVVVLCGAKLA
jgi:hypothetical protein